MEQGKIAVKLMRRTFSRVGWAMTLLAVVAIVSQLAIVLAVRRFAPQFAQSEVVWWILSSVPLYGFGLLAFALATAGMPSCPPRAGSDLSVAQIGLAACVCLAMSSAGGFTGNLFNQALGALKGSPVSNPTANLPEMQLLPQILIVCVIGPVVEEFLFRGLLINKLRGYGEAVCVFASAYLFALLHGNTWQFAGAFIVGGAYAFITLKTGTVVYSILLHMTNNLFATFVLRLVSDEGNPMMQMLAVLASLTMMAAIVAGFAVLVVSARKIRLDNAGAPGCGDAWRRLGAFLTAPGVVVYSILHIGLITYAALFS